MFLFDRMNKELVKAVMDTMPGEISVIDELDEVVGWNKNETRLFHRPSSSMGINFRECHPKESLSKVEQIVAEMRAGSRERARFWIQAKIPNAASPHLILIDFYALRDESGRYIGCLEHMLDVEEIRHLQGEKRLLD